MAIRKSDFQKIARTLIGPGGVFEDMLSDCILVKTLTADYGQESPKQTQTFKMVDTANMETNLTLEMVEGGYIELIGLYQDLNFEPNVNDTVFSFDGDTYNYIKKYVDPAKATITITGKR